MYLSNDPWIGDLYSSGTHSPCIYMLYTEYSVREREENTKTKKRLYEKPSLPPPTTSTEAEDLVV